MTITFKKRQKEMKRLEKRREKEARRAEKKLAKKTQGDPPGTENAAGNATPEQKD